MRRYVRAQVLAIAAVVAQPCLGETVVVGVNGCVEAPVFESEWRKFSDFDTSEPLQSRSWAAQQFEAAQAEMRTIENEITLLSAHMELDRAARLEARKLEQALRQGLKANLLRAFWRLSWITYNTIGGPTGKTEMIKAGRSYAELFSDKISVASTAKMLGVVKKLVPKQYAKLPGNEGRVVNVGVDVMLEALKNSEKSRLELVASVVTKVLDTGGKELLEANAMKADITPEEIAILRTQYLDQQALKQALDESYRLNGERSKRIEALEAQAREAAAKAKEWEQAEKRRVYSVLNENCRKTPSLQFGLSAPPSVVAGDVAEVRAVLPPGHREEDFTYAWMFDGEGSISSSTVQHFQSMRTGPHKLSVGFYQAGPEGMHLGNINAEIQVVAATPEAAKPAAGAGPGRVRISRLTVKPEILNPGDVVEFEVAYSVSGLPAGKQMPVSIRFVGQGFDETTRGEVVNGEFSGWYRIATTRWKPGRYTVQTAVTVAGAADQASSGFVLRQPDVAVIKPPPGGVPNTNARDFVGDWEGTGTVVASGLDGLRPGDRVPMKVRITRQAGAYQVYDLLDPDSAQVPMASRVAGNSVVFYYKGPAVDTRGYEHPDMPIDLSWTLTLVGNQISGDFVFAMEDGKVIMNVRATRAR